MIPILYEKDEFAFTSNGLGRLRDCITCEVTEERNGIYECDFTYPVDGANYEDIICGRIIGVVHDDSDDVQPFDIVSYSRPMDGVVTFHCVHISYRLTGYTTSGTNINTLADALTMLSTTNPPMPFTFESNFTSTGYMSSADGTPRTVRQFLGGVEGSILDTYGGEYEWERFRVLLKKARGEQRDFTVRYGLNMVSYEEESDYNGTYNQCIPYWTDGQNSVYGDVVSSGSPTYTGRDICVPLDLSDKFEEMPTQANLEAKALSYMQNKQTNLPRQNIKVDFIRLQDSPEYEQFESLLQCRLCDSIGVVFPLYGMQGTFKIVRTVYDVLGERFTEMELGALSVSLSEALGIDQMGGGSYIGGGINELVAGDGITITGSGDSRTIAQSSDFIVDQGTSGIWTYRKWNSGIAECWKRTGNNTYALTNNLNGNGWASDWWSLPSGLFTSVEFATINRISGGSGLISCSINNISTTRLDHYVWIAGTTGTYTMQLSIYVLGRWK